MADPTNQIDWSQFELVDEGPSSGGIDTSLFEVIDDEPSPQAVGSRWRMGDALKQLGSGALESTAGLFGLAYDGADALSRWIVPGYDYYQTKLGRPEMNMRATNAIGRLSEEYLPAPDPNDALMRYSRTAGSFLGPTGAAGLLGKGVKAAGYAGPAADWLASQLGVRALTEAGSAAVGAQTAEEVTGNKNIAPLIGAVFGGAAPSVFADLSKAAYSLFRSSTPDEILGSAAKYFKETTGLTPDDLKAALAKRPPDELGQMMTTAELTDNAAIAQAEKHLAGTLTEATDYANRAATRTALRDEMLDKLTPVSGTNKAGLGARLTSAAQDEKKRLEDIEKILWGRFPRTVDVPVKKGQDEIKQILKTRQAGLAPGSQTKTLVEQYLAKGGEHKSGALQDIRSDALMLTRDGNLTPLEDRLLTTLSKNIDDEMNVAFESIGGQDYTTWLEARGVTKKIAELYKRGTAGGSLLHPDARPENLLQNAIKGDARSIQQLKEATRADPNLLESVKRGFLDLIPRDVDNAITPAGMKKFLASNEGAVSELLGQRGYDAMKRIVDDLRSEQKVQKLAHLASKGNSVTAQRQTVAGEIDRLLSESIIPGAGPVNQLANSVRKAVGEDNVKRVRQMIFKAALDPEAALKLAETPTTTRILNMVDRLKQGSLNALHASERAGALAFQSPESGPRQHDDRRVPNARPKSQIQSAPGTSQTSTSPQTEPIRPSDPAAAAFRRSGSSTEATGARQKAPAATGYLSPTAMRGTSPYLRPSVFRDYPDTPSQPIPSEDDMQTPAQGPEMAAFLKAIEHVESRGNAKAVSPKGAVGTHQVTPIAMRDVMRARGEDDSKYTDAELRELALQPGVSEEYGTAYLENLLERFGDPELALAAYNGGPSLVAKLLKQTGGTTFNDIRKHLPAETRNYVPAVLTRFQKLMGGAEWA